MNELIDPTDFFPSARTRLDGLGKLCILIGIVKEIRMGNRESESQILCVLIIATHPYGKSLRYDRLSSALLSCQFLTDIHRRMMDE